MHNTYKKRSILSLYNGLATRFCTDSRFVPHIQLLWGKVIWWTILLFILGLLVACSETPPTLEPMETPVVNVTAVVAIQPSPTATPSFTPTTIPTETPTPTAIPTGPVDITLWHIQGSGRGSELIDNAISRFQTTYPNATVVATLYRNDPYKEAIRSALAQNTPPCIFPSWGGGPLDNYVQAEQIIDLTERMNRGDYQSRFVAKALDSVTINDKIWGVPVENIAVAVVFFNKAIFEQYNLAPPHTYDEMLRLIDELVAVGITPFALANKTGWPGSMHYMYLVERLGGPEVFQAAMSGNGSFTDPVFVQAGTLLQDLVSRGAFAAGFNELDHDMADSRVLFYRGEAAMELMGTWNLFIIKSEYPDFFVNNLDFFPYPPVSTGVGDPANLIGTVGDHFYHISASCPYPNEAFQFIQYLIDDEAVQERTANGRIPPVNNFTTTDPSLQRVLEMVETAPHIQLWYDQALPYQLSEKHKKIIKQLLDLSITPDEAAQMMEDAVRQYDQE